MVSSADVEAGSSSSSRRLPSCPPEPIAVLGYSMELPQVSQPALGA